jgi:hypothetical protein
LDYITRPKHKCITTINLSSIQRIVLYSYNWFLHWRIILVQDSHFGTVSGSGFWRDTWDHTYLRSICSTFLRDWRVYHEYVRSTDSRNTEDMPLAVIYLQDLIPSRTIIWGLLGSWN